MYRRNSFFFRRNKSKKVEFFFFYNFFFICFSFSKHIRGVLKIKLEEPTSNKQTLFSKPYCYKETLIPSKPYSSSVRHLGRFRLIFFIGKKRQWGRYLGIRNGLFFIIKQTLTGKTLTMMNHMLKTNQHQQCWNRCYHWLILV